MATFRWRVATEGYGWVEDYYSPDLSKNTFFRHRGLCLIPREWVELSEQRLAGRRDQQVVGPEGWYWACRVYEPLKACSGLFRTFAATEVTPEGICAFADEYGHLGEGATWTWEVSNKPDFASEEEREEYEYTRDFVAVPQSFEDWQDAILKMRKAVSLWERFVRDRADERAARQLQDLVDKQLTDIRVQARFQLVPRPRNQPPLHLVPSTLLGALWVQLAEAVSGDKVLHQCQACRRWFELSPETNRISRVYCSDACRSRAYRSRKERARELAAAGTPIRKIARMLDSDEQTVAGWVEGKEGDKG
jgi:hypothetical protein